MSRARYAVYYAPAPDSPLWSFGSGVLGYDAATGASVPALSPEGVDRDAWTAMTATPRRYGFHATLKAPFRLAAGTTEDHLVAAGRAFAATQRPFQLPVLDVLALGAFVALAPKQRSAPLEQFAGACVEAFEPFRAQPSDAERARRMEAPLTPREQASLERWGYPYVFEDFHFHMSLTGALPADRIPTVVAGLSRLYADHVALAPIAVDAAALFVEDQPGDGFRIVDRFVFAPG